MDTGVEAYTAKEMADLAPHELPKRGPVCPKCKAIIPQFAELAPEKDERIRRLIRDGRKIMAVHELRALVRCPITWAKTWVSHGGRPDGIGTTAPCPYCGKPLATALAKQCPHCNMDWHDPKNPRRLGAQTR